MTCISTKNRTRSDWVKALNRFIFAVGRKEEKNIHADNISAYVNGNKLTLYATNKYILFAHSFYIREEVESPIQFALTVSEVKEIIKILKAGFGNDSNVSLTFSLSDTECKVGFEKRDNSVEISRKNDFIEIGTLNTLIDVLKDHEWSSPIALNLVSKSAELKGLFLWNLKGDLEESKIKRVPRLITDGSDDKTFIGLAMPFVFENNTTSSTISEFYFD